MTCPTDDDLIRRGDAIAACAVGPSDEWARATKSGYMQAATDCTFNVLRIPAAVSRAPLAASLPADPVTNAGSCQPVKVKPLEPAPAPVRGAVMAEKLKPCPFCGGDDLYFPHGTDPAVIECSGCGARSGVPDDQTEVEATAKWNVRVAPSLRITGPNSDGEYWLHIKAGGLAGGVNLGGERGPICKRLLDAASETGAKE